ncbi:glycine zipper 2TM domain-containing protein [Rhodoferax sp.]|uniref:glycine zipper 2TM domain-containing protein n=1 Tax=Rhodoferax sp. TaxID=50421 RepID=UPI002ACDC6EC|nr:glycine zipper 2TM domain-containing protein [Rhodoferax sp.]MDZ7918629.1 glycine zipper 2TM domain-containing protein [Rhodoferax sp.]
MNSHAIQAKHHFIPRMHPLVAVAAGSVVLVSLLGAAAITGILPSSNANVPAAIAVSAPADVKPLPAATAQQKTASQKAPTQKSSTQVASASTAPAQPAAAPAQQNSAIGIGIGAVVGGALGSQIGSGDGKTLATIAGAVGGGYIGNEIAKKNAAP